MFCFNFSKILYKLTKLTLLIWLIYIILSVNKIPDFNDNINNKHNLLKNFNGLNQIQSLNLIIAHPDDEIMFFSPTLLNLNDLLPKNITFNIVCYSDGNAQGLGSTRFNELYKSIHLLLSDRINKNITVLNYTDGMSEIWDVDKMLSDFEKINMNQPNYLITDHGKILILTFDKFGVSNHVNHISCHQMALRYYQKFPNQTLLLTLRSYHNNILLKYSSFGWQSLKLLFDLFYPSAYRNFLTANNNEDQDQDQNQDHTSKLTFFSTYPQYVLSLATMLNAHKSQMVWFRYLWWVFSRFVFVNDIEVIQS